MSWEQYPVAAIVNNLTSKFFEYRGLTLTTRGMENKGEVFVNNTDSILQSVSNFSFVRIDAKRNNPRGLRDWVVILILNGDGGYSNHSPMLRKLMSNINLEPAAIAGRLDELIIIVEVEFFKKKNLTDVIKNMQVLQTAGPDLTGKNPRYNVYPYYNFSIVVPEHKAVPVHRILSQSECDDILSAQHILRSDLPVILTSDAVIVWIGGREGQIVEITRDSHTAGISIYYRRIESDLQ